MLADCIDASEDGERAVVKEEPNDVDAISTQAEAVRHAGWAFSLVCKAWLVCGQAFLYRDVSVLLDAQASARSRLQVDVLRNSRWPQSMHVRRLVGYCQQPETIFSARLTRKLFRCIAPRLRSLKLIEESAEVIEELNKGLSGAKSLAELFIVYNPHDPLRRSSDASAVCFAHSSPSGVALYSGSRSLPRLQRGLTRSGLGSLKAAN